MSEGRQRGSAVAPSRVLLVLGMHRSGTSAVASALGRCGAALGDRLIDAAPDNPQGYFENVDTVLANERLLDALDRAWDDVRTLPRGWEESAHAEAAARSIHADVMPPFTGERLWALKDPRMCRVLPLWTRELRVGGAEPMGLLVLRHPDEVAASLAARDGMHPRTARILWLRHSLESALAAPGSSAVLRYEDLLRDPGRALSDVAGTLGLTLDIDPDVLRLVLDADARHHRAAAWAPEDAWHALCLDAYAALASDGWRDHVEALAARLDALAASSDGWVDAVGMAAREADRRRRRAGDEAIAAHRRADELQVALDRADVLAGRHLQELAALDRAGRETSEGLERAEALARERTAEAERLAVELERTQQAKSTAEALLAEARDAAARMLVDVRSARDAQARAESLASERLRELQTLAAAQARAESLASERLRELQTLAAAQARAESLASERLHELQTLAAAHAQAESFVRSRTAEAQALTAQLVEARAALAQAQALVREREQEAGSLAEALSSTQRGLADAERLALERLDDLQRHAHALAAEQAARGAGEQREARHVERIAALEASLAEVAAERGALRARLARIMGSRLWPAFARAARLPRDVPGV